MLLCPFFTNSPFYTCVFCNENIRYHFPSNSRLSFQRLRRHLGNKGNVMKGSRKHRGRPHIKQSTRGREMVEILFYCVIKGKGYLSQYYITHFASDSTSIFSNLSVWLHLRVEEWVKFHIHMLPTCSIYHDSGCDRFACQFLVRSFWGRVFLIYYITLGVD